MILTYIDTWFEFFFYQYQHFKYILILKLFLFFLLYLITGRPDKMQECHSVFGS